MTLERIAELRAAGIPERMPREQWSALLDLAEAQLRARELAAARAKALRGRRKVRVVRTTTAAFPRKPSPPPAQAAIPEPQYRDPKSKRL